MSRTWKEAFRPNWKDIDGFNCNNSGLTSLEGAPTYVDGDFLARHNRLSSLKGAPSYVGARFDCGNNRLASLDGAPSFIGKIFFADNNNLTSLKDVHLQIKYIGKHAYFDGNPIKSHVLGLLLIDGLQGVVLDSKRTQDIINRHLPSNGMESALLCQEELILAGLEEFAQL